MKEPKVRTEYFLIRCDLDLSIIKKIVVDYVDKKYFYTREGYKIRKHDFHLVDGDYSGYYKVIDKDWIEELYNKTRDL